MATRINDTFIAKGSETLVKANATSKPMKVAIAYGAMIGGLELEDVLPENISMAVDQSLGLLQDSIYSDTNMVILKAESNWLNAFLGTEIELEGIGIDNKKYNARGTLLAGLLIPDEHNKFYLYCIDVK